MKVITYQNGKPDLFQSILTFHNDFPIQEQVCAHFLYKVSLSLFSVLIYFTIGVYTYNHEKYDVDFTKKSGSGIYKSSAVACDSVIGSSVGK